VAPSIRLNLRLIAHVLVIACSIGIIHAQTDIPGCTDVWACNYNPQATESDGSCDYQSCIGCTNAYACNFDPNAIYYDNSCEYVSCVGCMSIEACNFDPNALIPNQASCDFESCVGCTDFTACTFDPEATLSDPNLCVYPLPNEDCDGNPTGCGGCEPQFISDFPTLSFGCADEMPLTTQDTVIAVSGCSGDTLDVGSFVVDATQDYVINVGTTADGIGPDGAIRVFGLTALGLANSDYFVESYPLIVSRYANGIAVITGQVQNVLNPNLKWTVHMVLEDETNAFDWVAESPLNGFVAAYGCQIDTSSTTTYRLVSENSYLIGDGGYEGSFLQLSHMPLNESKRFQLGMGGNSVNCNYGLGGWFSWNGQVLGQPVNGMTGDLVIDLESDIQVAVQCGNEMVIHFHHAMNTECGQFTEALQIFMLNDTTAPVWNDSACENELILCFDAAGGVDLPPPCEFAFEDECGELVSTSISEVILEGDPNLSPETPFTIERVYTGTDCSGNVSSFTQIVVYEGAPCASGIQLNDLHFEAVKGSQNGMEKPVKAWMPAAPLIKLYPNPTNNHSILELALPDPKQNVRVEVFNLAGQKVFELEDSGKENQIIRRIQLNGNSLSPGCYVIHVNSNSVQSIERWIIE